MTPERPAHFEKEAYMPPAHLQQDVALKPTGDESPVVFFTSLKRTRAVRLMRERFTHPVIRYGVGFGIVFFMLRSVGVV